MKKTFIVLAALCIAGLANAQITLEHVFDGMIFTESNSEFRDNALMGLNIPAPYFYSFDEQHLKLYDKETYQLYKTVSYGFTIYTTDGVWIRDISTNIFTTDGKVAFIFSTTYKASENAEWKNYVGIIDEDGHEVFDLSQYNGAWVVKVGNQYKLFAQKGYNYSSGAKTYVYSLPGTGEIQSAVAPSSPSRYARKISRNGQVLVQTEDATYLLTGTEINQ